MAIGTKIASLRPIRLSRACKRNVVGMCILLYLRSIYTKSVPQERIMGPSTMKRKLQPLMIVHVYVTTIKTVLVLLMVIKMGLNLVLGMYQMVVENLIVFLRPILRLTACKKNVDGMYTRLINHRNIPWNKNALPGIIMILNMISLVWTTVQIFVVQIANVLGLRTVPNRVTPPPMVKFLMAIGQKIASKYPI